MGPASYITIIVITKFINPLHENLLCNCHTNRLRYETMHHPFLFFFEQSHISSQPWVLRQSGAGKQ